MSMKFLFNRTSLVVRLFEAAGLVLSLVYFFRLSRFDLRAGLIAFLVACYLFLKICDLTPWAGIPRTLGIRVHFQKALVPMSYILTATALFALLDIPVLSTTVAMIAVLMMLVVAPVNGILIYFHHRDKDPLPMNYFSSNEYLVDEDKGPLENEKLQTSVR